jgi:protein arginine N-methyltransferase 1
MIKEGILPPLKEEGFDPNDKSTYFNEEEYIKKIGVAQEKNNYLLPSEVYSSIFDQHISTLSFRAAIEINSEFFEDKTVLVINSGIGLYSLFCGKAGAKKVYSIEPNKTYFKFQKKIVQLNKYQDIIEVYNCDVEDIYNIEKVDIIVCEWMGNFLLSNSFLRSVIYARDKFLVRDGLIFPDKATLYICGIQDEEFKQSKFKMWDNVYNVNMSCVKNVSFKDPYIDTFNKKNILSTICPIFEVDLYKIKESEINFSNSYELIFNKNDNLSALAGWFDVEFSKTPNKIRFTTSPFNQYTRWKQTIFYLEKNIKVYKGSVLTGSFCVRVDPNSQDMNCIDIKISYQLVNKNANFSKIKQSDDDSEQSEEINNNSKGIQMFKLSY